MTKPMCPSRHRATLLGILALIFWATVAPLTRSLTASVGPLLLVGISSATAGIVLVLVEWRAGHSFRTLLSLSRQVLCGAGLAFLLYFLLYPFSFSLASSDTVAIQLGLVNYFWPALTILCAVPVLKERPRWLLLLAGCTAALCGTGIAILPQGGGTLLTALREDAIPFLAMFVAALSWALHTVFVRRLEARSVSPLPLFQLGTGLICLLLGLLAGEEIHLSGTSLWELVYYSLVPITLGYALWDYGIRCGNFRLLTSLAYLLPLASTLFGCWLFALPLTPGFLFGSLLVMAGAILCRLA